MLFASFLYIYIYICVWIEIDQILRPIRKLKDKIILEVRSRASWSFESILYIQLSRYFFEGQFSSGKVGKIFGENDGIHHEGGSQCEQWCVPSGGCIRSRSQKSFVLRAIIGRRCGPTGTRRGRGSWNFFPGTILAELFRSLSRFPSIFSYESINRTLASINERRIFHSWLIRSFRERTDWFRTIFYLCLSPRRSISFLRDNPLFHGFEHGVVETKVNRNRRSWRSGSSSSTRNTPICVCMYIYIISRPREEEAKEEEEETSPPIDHHLVERK